MRRHKMKFNRGDEVKRPGEVKILRVLAVHEQQGVYDLSDGLMASDDTIKALSLRTAPVWPYVSYKPALLRR